MPLEELVARLLLLTPQLLAKMFRISVSEARRLDEQGGFHYEIDDKHLYIRKGKRHWVKVLL